jgi:hypothetical protein
LEYKNPFTKSGKIALPYKKMYATNFKKISSSGNSNYMNKPKLWAVPVLAVSLILLQFSAFAQNIIGQKKAMPATLSQYVKKATVFSLNKKLTRQLLANKQTSVELSFEFENSTIILELEENNVFSKGFFAKDGAGNTIDYDKKNSLHYKGKIKGDNSSVVALNIHEDEINGILSNRSGNINIGAIENGSGDMIIFRETDLVTTPPFSCEALTAPGDNPVPDFNIPSFFMELVNTEAVDVYFEADYSCYTGKGSNLTNTINWVTDLASNVSILYENDSVNLKMSAVKVWTVNDPYESTVNTSEALNAFSLAMTGGFPGDLAHLLSRRGLGGGRAYLDILCNSPQFRTGVSGNLNNGITPLPAYSWNSMVITHELGHNIVSPHTQSCSWPGGAIDNCYAVEGTCPPGPAPVNGGTIMSYCHLTGYGINLSNGFGPLPGAAVRNAVRNSSCIYPRVSFNKVSETLAEEAADTDNDCLDYKQVTLRMNVNYTPTAPVNIQLLPIALSSGLEIGAGKDIEVLTPLNFTLNDTIAQNIELKIFDDAVIENTETLRIDYNIAANGTNAVKGSLYSINITSADHRPDSAINQLLLYESFDGTDPLNNWTQNIIHGINSPNRWITGNSGDVQFSGRSLYISNNNTNLAYAGNSLNDSSVIRIISPAINATGFYGLRLAYLYKCMGEGVAGQGTGSTAVDFGRLYYSSNNGVNWTVIRDNIYSRSSILTEQISLPSSANNNPAVRLAFEWRNNSSVVNNPPFVIDSLIITGAGPGPIQTESHFSNSDTAYVGPNATVHFYNQVTGKVMATIKNLSAFDFGCTQVDLLRTGTTAAQAWGLSNAEKLTDKAFKITPANNSTSAPYELSLYATEDESEGWLAATGNAATELNIIKSSTDITQTPPAASPDYSNTNSIANFGFRGDKIIKGTFSGFSWFALGKPGISNICPGSTKQFTANGTGTAYQWQVNTGSGFTNISNAGNYSGTNTATLTLSNAPTSWYGYKYRCMITTATGTEYSYTSELKFTAVWKGTTNTLWNTSSNWECGTMPDNNTDVYIVPDTLYQPVVNINTAVRTLTVMGGATVTVVPSVQISVLK